MRIVIREGKFYRGNVEVKPEFGNWEQIRALKAEEAKGKMTTCEAKLTEQEIVKYYARVNFTCPLCSQANEIDYDEDLEEFPIDSSDVDELEVECCKCKHEFTIHADKSKKGCMSIYLSYDNPNSEETEN